MADARRVAEAEASSRAKSEFLAAMSHELRTPLNAIGGYTELLEVGVAGPVTEQQQDFLMRIRLAQQHLLGIINDLLNYSRIEAGQITYDMASVSLGEMVDRVTAMVTPQANAKGITISRERWDASITARADQLKLEQVVLNILSNAVKFTPRRGSIMISCDADEKTRRIRIRDTGPGVPATDAERIFEPFVQLGRSHGNPQEGAGLGLAISRDLARAMGGELSLAQGEHEGAEFVLELLSG
jgi:signal transduction histidine kinase